MLLKGEMLVALCYTKMQCNTL